MGRQDDDTMIGNLFLYWRGKANPNCGALPCETLMTNSLFWREKAYSGEMVATVASDKDFDRRRLASSITFRRTPKLDYSNCLIGQWLHQFCAVVSPKLGNQVVTSVVLISCLVFSSWGQKDIQIFMFVVGFELGWVNTGFQRLGPLFWVLYRQDQRYPG